MLSKSPSVESAFLMMQEKNLVLANRLWFRLAKEIENKILENAGIVEKAMMEGEIESKEPKEAKTKE